MAERKDLLIEIGTEELPPKSLGALARAFGEGLQERLDAAGLEPGEMTLYYTPRRMTVYFQTVLGGQAESVQRRLGPAVAAAFDDDGQPTPAAQGFARSAGVAVEDLERETTDKGERLAAVVRQPGRATGDLLPELIGQSLKALPVPKPMRWGALEEAFVRPVHWIVALLGDEVVPGSLYGQAFGRESRGHRFHHPDPVIIERSADYPKTLRAAQVVVDPAERRATIREQCRELAAEFDGRPVSPEALVDEVANLVEWPVALPGQFEDAFLEVPQEALISSMQGHQRFFPIVDATGALQAHFVGFANIESRDPAAVTRGLERVIRPRLADARFFWRNDARSTLESRLETLDRMVYQHTLGSLKDKSERVARLAADIGRALGEDPEPLSRAAWLCKCDLVTDMVYEFPELQGTMGRYYAQADGEDEAVAQAIEDHYRPRFAGDSLPEQATGRLLAIADRLDTLAGIFAAGLKPTGNKDPFALRRAALGLVRLLIEDGPDLDLKQWIQAALAGVSSRIEEAPQALDDVLDFVMERLRAYYADLGIGGDAFEAVWARRPTRVRDFHARVQACQVFRVLESAAALTAANKRIGNLLRKAREDGEAVPGEVDGALIAEAAERELQAGIQAAHSQTRPLVQARDYTAMLDQLAGLRPQVDRFFDEVMVMVEDASVRGNRLALLDSLKRLFDEVADISHLVIEGTT